MAFIVLLAIGGTVGWSLAVARGDLLDRLRHSLRIDPRADLESAVQSTLDERAAAARGQYATGLGLAIARHITDGHDGRIWVESEEGRGSTFSFAIPTSEAA